MVKAGRNSLLFKFLFISRPFFPSKYFIDLQGIERPPLSDGFYESLDESVDVSTLLRSYKTITAQADRFIREKGSPAALN